jgi:hypothetical protein
VLFFRYFNVADSSQAAFSAIAQARSGPSVATGAPAADCAPQASSNTTQAEPKTATGWCVFLPSDGSSAPPIKAASSAACQFGGYCICIAPRETDRYDTALCGGSRRTPQRGGVSGNTAPKALCIRGLGLAVSRCCIARYSKQPPSKPHLNCIARKSRF